MWWGAPHTHRGQPRLGLPAKVIADQGYTLDAFTAFFRRSFWCRRAGDLGIHYAPRLRRGIGELYALICFALTGMLLAAGSTSFVMLFVAIELIITFYVLTVWRRTAAVAGSVLNTILGAASSAVMASASRSFTTPRATCNFVKPAMLAAYQLEHTLLFKLGIMLVLGGLAFKIAAVPSSCGRRTCIRAHPRPSPLSLLPPKAAGFALLLRVLEACSVNGKLYGGLELQPLLAVMAAATILYGSLGAFANASSSGCWVTPASPGRLRAPGCGSFKCRRGTGGALLPRRLFVCRACCLYSHHRDHRGGCR